MAPAKPMKIAVTPGEPAGIGPDIIIKLSALPLPACPLVIADPELLQQRAAQLKLAIQVHTDAANCPAQHQPGHLWVQPVSLAQTAEAGQLNPANAAYVLQTLKHAVQGCLRQDYAALVTGPVQKSLLQEAGFAFSGHTEYLGELTQAEPLMLLANPLFRVALLTTHIPLAEVSKQLTAARLQQTLYILERDLKTRFQIAAPRILVAGLNPHAGEQGYLGREEIDVMQPVITRLQQAGMRVQGPLPADTLFTPHYLEHSDVVLSMYHDQGLPVLKYAGFGKAVNITLGLSIIRTSVDHGTALSLAGSGAAEVSSLQAAFQAAYEMAMSNANAR